MIYLYSVKIACFMPGPGLVSSLAIKIVLDFRNLYVRFGEWEKMFQCSIKCVDQFNKVINDFLHYGMSKCRL